MDGWDIALSIASGADLASTLYVLEPGVVKEGNPFAPQAIEALVAVKLAGTAGIIAIRHLLEGHGVWGRRVGLGLVILGMVAFSVAATLNLVRFK